MTFENADSLRSKHFCRVREQRIDPHISFLALSPFSARAKYPKSCSLHPNPTETLATQAKTQTFSIANDQELLKGYGHKGTKKRFLNTND